MIESLATPAATASSITSAMKTEQDVRELPALLLDERAGAGATGLVHGRVDHAAVGQAGVLGVLSADFEDGVDTRVVVKRALGVGDNLVEDVHAVYAVAGRQQGADDLAAAAGRTEGYDRIRTEPAGGELSHQGLGGGDRLSVGGDVALPDHFAAVAVEGHDLRTGGADVEAEDQPAGTIDAYRSGRLALHALDPVEVAGEGGHPFELVAVMRRQNRVQCRRRRRALGRHQGTSQSFKEEGIVFLDLDHAHAVPFDEHAEVFAHPPRAGHAADEHDLRRAETRLDQHLHVLADRIVEAGEDARAALALVGEVGHVGLEDHRATTGQRRGLGLALDRGAGLVDAQVEALHELTQEVAGALGTAGVLAEHLGAAVAQLQHREAVTADGDQGGRPVAAQPAQPGDLRLGDRDPRQRDLAAQPSAGRRPGEAVPVPILEQSE
jgi:hypothetical protein